MTNKVASEPLPDHHDATHSKALVIAASSLGTVFEWYDFYLYGLLATIISAQFFSGVNETTGFIFALARLRRGIRGAAVRGAGVRPDRRPGRAQEHLPRHHGRSWACRPSLVGLLPSYASDRRRRAGRCWSLLRLLQGLALGGEYGGAATYVAEHAPDEQARPLHQLHPDHRDARPVRGAAGRDRHAHADRRGGVRGLGLARAVPASRSLLLAVSLWIRLQLDESPVFQKMKDEGDDVEGAADRSVRRAGATCRSC